MGILLLLATFVILGILIYLVGDRFAESSSHIGDYLNLPKDVKGATFDAVSSSMPELLVALFSVIFFNQFEVGIGTIAGSALFNLLVIPGLCVLAAPVAFKVSKNVISRDALFYLVAVFLLVVLIIYFKVWGIIIGLVLIFFYFFYLGQIISDSRAFRLTNKKKKQEVNIKKETVPFFLLLFAIGGITYLLTKASIDLATLLNVSPIIIAFTITAAATSAPDTIISLANAKKGNIDDATSNVFGSNVFDIFIGLGLPIFIYNVLVGPVVVEFANLEILLGLLGATILVLYFFAQSHTLKRKHAYVLLLLYVLFVLYTISLAVH